MSRSVHTRPDEIRAAERVRLPYAPRGRHGRQHWTRIRMLRDNGIATRLMPPLDAANGDAPLPRIVERRPGAGLVQAVDAAAIRDLLRFFGERSHYGLRSIELTAGAARDLEGLVFGALVGTGVIRLYAQPEPPWLLPGAIDETELHRLVRAGARVEMAKGGLHTRVEWPGKTLRDFMLLDVFLHEIGHHIVQQYTGKRTARVRRTRDHEIFAERFARRGHERYLSARSSGG